MNFKKGEFVRRVKDSSKTPEIGRIIGVDGKKIEVRWNSGEVVWEPAAELAKI